MRGEDYIQVCLVIQSSVLRFSEKAGRLCIVYGLSIKTLRLLFASVGIKTSHSVSNDVQVHPLIKRTFKKNNHIAYLYHLRTKYTKSSLHGKISGIIITEWFH